MSSALVRMVISTIKRSTSSNFSRGGRGGSGFVGSPRVLAHHKSWVSRAFYVAVIVCLVISFLLAFGCGYIYVFPSLTQAFHGYGMVTATATTTTTVATTTPIRSIPTCDVFNGSWIKDDSYPLYNGSLCPFTERGFNCIGNGRKDTDYLKWRWKPNNCNIPKFHVAGILNMLRGKRIVFVGDSMSRTQWESLICLLMTGVEDKESVYEVNNHRITKQIRFLGVRFSSHNFTVEFFRSVFLVQRTWGPRKGTGPKRVRGALKLDKLDDISKQWIDADVLIFNTGQWWTPGKLFDTGCYFQVDGSLKLGMPITSGFRMALDTWASWVETNVNTNRTRVFFRTFEPSHWSGRTLKGCHVTQQPMSDTEGKDQSPLSYIITDVVKNMTVPVTVLHVTPMSAFRSDAHVGSYSDTPIDCSHWCLPGVPDMWNEIVFSYLLPKDEPFSLQHTLF
ncbi:hypothetical protein GIB67_034715 [Kingdonia uniflora]|uniref:Trichome birefringence-like N-terminal domain-containing protein n=1 Tax=Kingdonia uniflora TaxID=39325 RepID=A0A7J7MLH7_9MAGN|nr:hypothetical protein GIB67_034715 [Kingdonia uniflora]